MHNNYVQVLMGLPTCVSAVEGTGEEQCRLHACMCTSIDGPAYLWVSRRGNRGESSVGGEDVGVRAVPGGPVEDVVELGHVHINVVGRLGPVNYPHLTACKKHIGVGRQ